LFFFTAGARFFHRPDTLPVTQPTASEHGRDTILGDDYYDAFYFFSVAPTLGKHDYGDRLVLKAGTSAVIEIPFSASPEPSVEWKYKGARLSDTRRFREETVPGMTSLSMSKVTKKDAGDYSMTLQNQLGKATFTIKIIVQGSQLLLDDFRSGVLAEIRFTDALKYIE